MLPRIAVVFAFLLVAVLGGCQVINTGTETRMDEQMLDVSYENAKAQQTLAAIIYGTDRQEHVIARIGSPTLSLYSQTETVAFNAHCNDHIRAVDTNGDLRITQNEAEVYYQRLVEQGKIKEQKQ